MDTGELGAGTIGLVFRFFRNVMNFSSLSTIGKLRTVSIPVLALGVPGYGYASNAMIVKTLDLTPAQVTMVETCEASHDTVGFAFGGMISTEAGCGCAAKLVSASIPESHLKHYGAAYDMVFEAYNIRVEASTEAGYEAAYKREFSALSRMTADANGLSRDQFENLATQTMAADMICDDSGVYKGAALTEIAALEPFAEPIWTNEVSGTVEVTLRGAERPMRVASSK